MFHRPQSKSDASGAIFSHSNVKARYHEILQNLHSTNQVAANSEALYNFLSAVASVKPRTAEISCYLQKAINVARFDTKLKFNADYQAKLTELFAHANFDKFTTTSVLPSTSGTMLRASSAPALASVSGESSPQRRNSLFAKDLSIKTDTLTVPDSWEELCTPTPPASPAPGGGK